MRENEVLVNKLDFESLDREIALQVACDGASKGNPGVGGYGWFHSDLFFGWGGEPNATNNAMELKALASLLKSVPDWVNLDLFLDSRYVIESLSKYIHVWRVNGYKTSAGREIANKVLIMEIDELILSRSGAVKFNWVKGHMGHKLNEEADRLANKGAEEILKFGRIS